MPKPGEQKARGEAAAVEAVKRASAKASDWKFDSWVLAWCDL